MFGASQPKSSSDLKLRVHMLAMRGLVGGYLVGYLCPHALILSLLCLVLGHRPAGYGCL